MERLPIARHVGRPNMPGENQFFRYAEEIFANEWFTNDGPFNRRFEAELAQFIGDVHVVTVCNATLGLELTLSALEVAGEVIVPSFTFVATVHAVERMGLRPVFADIDPRTHNLDPLSVERVITDQTAAILPVHLWGSAADTDAFQSLAEGYGLRLIYDAAHSFAASGPAGPVGKSGHAEVFSFHATKFFNSFEGGAIVTSDAELAERLRLARNFGFGGLDDVRGVGTNAKLSEICAAMGVANLPHVPDLLQTNKAKFDLYAKSFSSVDEHLRLLQPSKGSNFQYVVALVQGDEPSLRRDELIRVLNEKGCKARKYFWPGCHRFPPYNSRAHCELPVTEDVANRVIVLPTGASMTDADVESVGSIVSGFFDD